MKIGTALDISLFNAFAVLQKLPKVTADRFGFACQLCKYAKIKLIGIVYVKKKEKEKKTALFKPLGRTLSTLKFKVQLLFFFKILCAKIHVNNSKL